MIFNFRSESIIFKQQIIRHSEFISESTIGKDNVHHFHFDSPFDSTSATLSANAQGPAQSPVRLSFYFAQGAAPAKSRAGRPIGGASLHGLLIQRI